MVAEEQFTPFILVNSPVAGHREGVMGQVDMYPTLLNLLGLDDYEWKGLGQSVLSPEYHGLAISSMTNEVLGDTTSVSSAVTEHLRRARTMSDGMIRSNYLRTLSGADAD